MTIKDEKNFNELKNNKEFIKIVKSSTIIKKMINIFYII